jgi:hypothetical protein
MSFFIGWDGHDGHDELAREIGEAGKRWAEEHVRAAHVLLPGGTLNDRWHSGVTKTWKVRAAFSTILVPTT